MTPAEFPPQGAGWANNPPGSDNMASSTTYELISSSGRKVYTTEFIADARRRRERLGNIHRIERVSALRKVVA